MKIALNGELLYSSWHETTIKRWNNDNNKILRLIIMIPKIYTYIYKIKERKRNKRKRAQNYLSTQ